MDIAALSMSLSQMKVAQEASVSVMKLAMDTAQGQMQDLTKIMEQSVNPNLGTSIDIKG
ncbi:YjfB family protein [Acetoanaerobium noterae]|uniref:YjfB family protein n=1 Tax=Acetoanaerobium noterae TaxID=745369 RepID=UPI0028A6FFF2|nr:YjfB family protein [Acetoanaerobium noterae]